MLWIAGGFAWWVIGATVCAVCDEVCFPQQYELLERLLKEDSASD